MTTYNTAYLGAQLVEALEAAGLTYPEGSTLYSDGTVVWGEGATPQHDTILAQVLLNYVGPTPTPTGDLADFRKLVTDIATEISDTQDDIDTINTTLSTIDAATAAQVRSVVKDMLQREKHELQVKIRVVRAVRWLIRNALRNV